MSAAEVPVEPSVRVRARVYARDGGVCAAARPACSGPVTIQHRKNRSQGGGGEYENLLTLCAGCNAALESDAAFARLGRLLGWKVEGWEEPAAVAVFIRSELEWRLLDPVGGFEVVSSRGGRDAAAEWRDAL